MLDMAFEMMRAGPPTKPPPPSYMHLRPPKAAPPPVPPAEAHATLEELSALIAAGAAKAPPSDYEAPSGSPEAKAPPPGFEPPEVAAFKAPPLAHLGPPSPADPLLEREGLFSRAREPPFAIRAPGVREMPDLLSNGYREPPPKAKAMPRPDMEDASSSAGSSDDVLPRGGPASLFALLGPDLSMQRAPPGFGPPAKAGAVAPPPSEAPPQPPDAGGGGGAFGDISWLGRGLVAAGALGLDPSAPEWFPPSRAAPPSSFAFGAPASEREQSSPSPGPVGRSAEALRRSLGGPPAEAPPPAPTSAGSGSPSPLARTAPLDLDQEHPPEALKGEIRRQRQEISELKAQLARVEAEVQRLRGP